MCHSRKVFSFFFSRKRRRDGVADVPSKDISIKPNVWGLPVRIGMALQTHLGKKETRIDGKLCTSLYSFKNGGDSGIHLYDCRVPVELLLLFHALLFLFLRGTLERSFLIVIRGKFVSFYLVGVENENFVSSLLMLRGGSADEYPTSTSQYNHKVTLFLSYILPG